MDWLSLLLNALRLVGPAVKTVEVIASEAHSGATKRQMAVDAITLGAGVADSVLSPADQQKSDAIAQLVGQAVDRTCAANKLGAAAQAITGAGTILPAAIASIGIAEQAN
jgi:hypothetical protein